MSRVVGWERPVRRFSGGHSRHVAPGGVRGRTQALGSWQEAAAGYRCLFSSTPWESTPARLPSCSTLLLRQHRCVASGPVTFRNRETEAQSSLSHLPGSSSSRLPHLEAHWQEEPQMVSVAQVYPPWLLSMGGCWLAAILPRGPSVWGPGRRKFPQRCSELTKAGALTGLV